MRCRPECATPRICPAQEPIQSNPTEFALSPSTEASRPITSKSAAPERIRLPVAAPHYHPLAHRECQVLSPSPTRQYHAPRHRPDTDPPGCRWAGKSPAQRHTGKTQSPRRRAQHAGGPQHEAPAQLERQLHEIRNRAESQPVNAGIGGHLLLHFSPGPVPSARDPPAELQRGSDPRRASQTRFWAHSCRPEGALGPLRGNKVSHFSPICTFCRFWHSGRLVVGEVARRAGGPGSSPTLHHRL